MAALFFLKTGTFGAKNRREISVDAILCFLIEIFFEKKGQIHSNFDKQKFLISPRIQHKVFLFVLLTVFAVGFWLVFILL